MFAINNTVRDFTFMLIRSMLFMVVFVGVSAYAEIFTFTEDTPISATDFSYDDHDIVIDGATVTIDGEHEFESLKVINGGVLTHSVEQKMSLIVSGTVEVDVDSAIDVSEKGLLAELSVSYFSGGSHGGRGGVRSTYPQPSAVSGSYTEPVSLGRGGRSGAPSNVGTNRGGGAVKIDAGNMILEGAIRSNGESKDDTSGHGAGSGGSIWLNADSLISSGVGKIYANGGNIRTGVPGGSGGGGRIAIYYESLVGFDISNVNAFGGLRGNSSSSHGSPGTVYLNNKTGVNSPALYIIGGGSSSEYSVTPLSDLDGDALVIENASVELAVPSHTFDADISLLNSNLIAVGDVTLTQAINVSSVGTSSLTVGGQLTVPNNALIVDGITLSLAQDHTFSSIHIKNGGVLTTPVATTGFENGIKLIADTITVDEGSRIDVSGKGFLSAAGTGNYTGGSHGGRGGSYINGQSSLSSGAYQEPNTVGWGGRSSTNGASVIRGGGAIRLEADTLTLNGVILASGESVTTSLDHGAGAGGSIWLNVKSLVSPSVSGEIRADGGKAFTGRAGAGGGGGRVAIYYELLDGFPESSVSVLGGIRGNTNGRNGSPGTVYFKDKTGAVIYPLTVRGQGSTTAYAVTPLSGLGDETALVIDDVRVELLDTDALQFPLTANNSEITLQQAILTEAIALTNSRLILTSDTTFNNTLSTESSVVTVQGNAQINTVLSLQNDAITIQGNATFTQPIVGNLGGTSSLTVGGQLSVSDNALIVDGITLSLAQDHTFASIHIKNGGVLTTPVATTEFANGIKLTADTITVDEGSRIDVSGKGFLGASGSGRYTGGSHGGRGGSYSTYQSGATFGEYQEPNTVGRGGRDNNTNGTGTIRGGGAIQLTVDTLNLHGQILANGANVVASSNGGGAGGSIWLNIGALVSAQLSGEIRADGGRGLGGGGGGRIAVYYEVLDGISQSNISVLGGVRDSTSGINGSPGTIYLNDKTGAVIYPLTIHGQGSTAAYAVTPLSGLEDEAALVTDNVRVELLDADALQFPLTANNSEITLQQAILTEVITLTNSRLILTSDTTFNNTLNAESSVITVQGNAQINTALSLQDDAIMIQGNATFTQPIVGNLGGTSSLTIIGQLTAPNNALIVDGITLSLAQDHTFASIHIKNGGVLTTPVATTEFANGIKLIADTITIDEGSRIDVSGKGFLSAAGVGVYTGGSHGGRGGNYSGEQSGPVYGNYQQPNTAGYGGRNHVGGVVRGGGAIRLTADTLDVNGSILANGNPISAGTHGGGAGGSIWLDVGALTSSLTSGEIQANGSNGFGANAIPGGGGGRIAIYHEVLNGISESQVSALGGRGSTNNNGVHGQPGTIYWEAKEAPPYIYQINLPAFSSEVISSLTLEFSIPMDADTIGVNDVVVQNVLQQSINPSSVTALNEKTFRFDFASAFDEGSYTLNVGPDIVAQNGLQLDQNRNGTGGEPEDIFTFNFTVDLSEPVSATVDVPLSPAVNKSTTTAYVISGTREDNTAIWINGTQAVSQGSADWNATVTLPQGLSTLTLFARDAAGNQSAAIEVIVDVDSIRPTIQTVVPSNGSVFSAVPPRITVNVVEAGSGLNLTQSAITVSRNTTQVSGNLTREGSQLIFTPITPFIEGSYTYQPILVDNHGNISSPATYNFVVDYTPPPAPVLNEYPALTSINTQVFSGTKEAGSRIVLDGQVVVGATSSTSWSYSKALVFGDNSFTFKARDAAGNESPGVVATIRYDDQAPGPVTLVVNANGSGTELSLNWSAYNELANGNDIATYRVYSATQGYTNVATMTPVFEVPAGTKTAKVTGLTRDTAYYVSVVAIDRQGLSISDVTPVVATPQDTLAPAEISNLQIASGATTIGLSWSPSANTDNDLASYRISYSSGGETQTINLSQADIGSSSPVTYTLTNLAPATAHSVRISAVDNTGNVSTGLTDPAITLLPNPHTVQAEGFSGRAELTWSSVSPHALVKHYAVYVQPSNFTSVEGLTPRLILPKGNASQTSLQGAVAGLTDGVTVYVAITAVNLSNGETNAVSPVSVTPQADSDGPEIASVVFTSSGNAIDLTQSPTLTGSGVLGVTATDKSSVSRVVLTLNGQPLANLTSATGGVYQYSLDLAHYADGALTLGVAAYDTLDNVTEASYTFTLDLAPPAAPVITVPAANQLVNQVDLSVSGTTEAGTRVRLMHNGAQSGNPLVADSQGLFSTTVSLAEGENTLVAQAQYADRDAWSGNSASRVITLNTELPNAPSGVTATAGKQGQVYVGWNAVTSSNGANPITGYRVYRASTSFSSKLDAGVQLVNTTVITGTAFTDLVITDGDYFYAVSSVNQAGNESALSALVQATVDSTGPQALNVVYDSNGVVDAVSGRMAPGTVQVAVTFSEPLRNKPYFAIVPNGGLPIAVELTKNFSDELLYTGQFQITDATPSGSAYVVMSAYDNAGNRGTEVLQGATLVFDTDGPEVASLALNPNDPLRVDEVNGLTIDVAITLNDELPAGELPVLIPMLEGLAVVGYEQGVELVRDALSVEGAPLWVGTFDLPVTAGTDDQGQPSVQNLAFAYSARDDLNNLATRIHGKNNFQVYQGDLPPLNVPVNLIAKAQAGGRVALSWDAVNGAAGYVLYRQGPNDGELIAQEETLTDTTFNDETQVDGTYLYAVASVRRENQQESLSGRSETVSVQTDRVAPGAPQNLALELNGAGLVSRWEAPLVDASGNSQNLQGLTYNLYRLDLAEGQQVTDLTDLTPIQTAIPALIALDTTPSESEHSYFVTAVDAAGNESLPSTTQYLNFGLLPVNRLNLVLADNGFPQLSWQHQGQAISHYRVYRRHGNDEPLLITDQPIAHAGTTTTYTDTGYNQAQASSGANMEVSYTVVAVDDNDVESLGHSIFLPALSTALADADNTRLARGVMNRVNFRVDNQGVEPVAGLRLFVNLTVNGVVKQHQSESFSVEAGAFALVPVVIGGYDKLDGIADLALRLEQTPRVNESIVIHQSQSLLVSNASLLPSLTTEGFVRGGSGVVSFTLENTSEVETEILMARNNGLLESNEVRLVLEDLQGNVLSVQPVKQFTGGVISIAGGRTVARMAPGQSFTSEPIAIVVPSASPDQVNLRLVIDKFHYHLGRDTHVEILGNGVRRELILSETPYLAEITSVSPTVMYGKGESVTVEGRALDRADGQALANVPVKLAFRVRGFETLATVYADADGHFSYSYLPDGTSGVYTVSALHPDVSERPNHGEFRVEGGSVSPRELTVNIPRNYTQKIPLRVTAGHDSTLTNIRLVQLGNDGNAASQPPLGITLSHDPVVSLNPRANGYLNLNFNGDNTAEASGTLQFRVEADNFTGQQALGTIQLRYSLSEAKPAVATQPAYIDTGVGLDKQIVENITVTNKGLDVLQNALVTLTDENGGAVPAWIRLATAPQLGNLAIGESKPVQINVAPGVDVAEGNYAFRLRVSGDNLASFFTVPVFVAVTQSAQGDAFFHVSDIYTATLNENNQLIPGLAGARIRLQNENVLTETFDVSTNAEGEALFEGIPAGRYTYRASAFDHSSVSGRVWIKPGVTTAENVFLMNSVVNVEWSVREITIEDRYEIKLEATFKTHVPVAVVLFSPLHVQLPVMKKGDLFHGELTLTNHGLIRATNVKQSLPASSDMARIEFLRDVPTALEAGEVFTLPYRIQALRDFNPAADPMATGAGCGSFNASTQVNYQSECANGTTVPGGTGAGWNSNWGGSSCGGGGGAGGSASYGGGGYGGGAGSSYSPKGSSVTSEEPLWCRAESECEDDNCDNASAK